MKEEFKIPRIQFKTCPNCGERVKVRFNSKPPCPRNFLCPNCKESFVAYPSRYRR